MSKCVKTRRIIVVIRLEWFMNVGPILFAIAMY